MARELAAILADLENVNLADDHYMSRLYDLAAELEAATDRSNAIGPVFRFIERHPDADLGAPGPLVHFLELFSGPEYETPLVASLSRQPTPMTVWMLNRLINSLRGSDREKYIEMLRDLSSETNPNTRVRESASRYLAHQTAP